MLTAIVKSPSRSLIDACELTFMERSTMNFERLQSQHLDYCDALEQAGVTVVKLAASPMFPDSVFVEDTAVILENLAIIARPGVLSRQGEPELIKATLASYRCLAHIQMPGTLDGGDVLHVGRTLFVGLSRRTNAEGVKQLTQFVKGDGYDVVTVDVKGSLHLKTACTALDESTLLLNADWVDVAPFKAFAKIPVPISEPFGANVLRTGSSLLINAAYPRTIDLVSQHCQSSGSRMIAVNISEFGKAEAGLSCMSLLIP